MTSFFSAEDGPIRIKFRKLVQNDMSTAVMWSKSKPDVEFQYAGRLGEFNGMSSQSHVSLCRVLPLGEFTVTIPQPHATLQGAVTKRNQCHRATLQGLRIPSAILKIVFAIFYFFLFLMQFRLWRTAAFVSSPIHLLKMLNEVSLHFGFRLLGFLTYSTSQKLGLRLIWHNFTNSQRRED